MQAAGPEKGGTARRLYGSGVHGLKRAGGQKQIHGAAQEAGEDVKIIRYAGTATEASRGQKFFADTEYEAHEKGSDHQEDEITRTSPAHPGPPGQSSCEESNRESGRLRSPGPTTKLRKATSSNFEYEKSTEEPEWESLTAVIATSRTTKNRKALHAWKLGPPEPLDGDDNKWKTSQRFDVWVNVLERFLACKDIDPYDRSALEL